MYIIFQTAAYAPEVLRVKGIGDASKAAGADSYKITEHLQKQMDTIFNADAVTKLMKDSSIIGTLEKQETNIFALFICIICVILILFNFFKLLLEMVERYAVLGMIFYTCPLAFSTLVTKKTSGIFHSWTSMVASQFLLMITNAFFLNVFIGAFANFGLTLDDVTIMTYVIYMLLLVAWLKIGQNVDQYLKGLGMSTAQCGGGLSSAVAGAVGGIVGGMARAGISKGAKAIGGKMAESKQAVSDIMANKQNQSDRQLKYNGAGGKTEAIKDAANVSNGFKNATSRAAAERITDKANALPDGGVGFKTNDGGEVKVGKNLGENGVNGVNDIGNGFQTQIVKDSEQARQMANLASNGDSAVESLASKCQNNALDGASNNHYDLSNSRGRGRVVEDDGGMIGFVPSSTTQIHPTLQRAGVSSLENSSSPVSSVAAQRFDGLQTSDKFSCGGSGETLTPIMGPTEGFKGAFIASSSDNMFVGASNITRDGLDYLDNIRVNAEVTGFDSGWRGAEIIRDNPSFSEAESIHGVEMSYSTYKEMENKGFFKDKLEEREFLEATFIDPAVEVNEYDFNKR